MPSESASHSNGPAIAFVDAAVTIGEREIWSNVNLDINQGEFVAILGPNGAGKSTFIKAVLGLQQLSAGSVTVLGEQAGAANEHIGYLPQRRAFDTSLPVRGIDVVRLGLDGNKWGLPVPFLGRFINRKSEQHKRDIVHQAIENVSATAYAERPIGRTSGGEQQRLLIAQALVRDPRLLLLDEPLDSLDIPNQHGIASLIQTISNERGITVMMVAHDVNPILPYLDRVIYVANGHVLSGSPTEVIRTDTLSELYGSPVEVLQTTDGRLVVAGAPDALHAHDHVVR